MSMIFTGYWICLIVLSIFSYGFIDLNLHLSGNPLFVQIQAPLSYLIFHMRPLTSGIFAGIVLVLFYFYIIFLRHPDRYFTTWKSLLWFLSGIYLVLVLAYPALTYDIFNYITTAKVAFTHRENPYVVMPVEIPNEPYLAFTRAANKYALYGPVWIAMTAVPHSIGGGNVWKTIIAFKFMNALGLLLLSYIIFRYTKSIKNTVFFALNPLVLIETLVSGHNDIFMMLFVIAGFICLQKKGRVSRVMGLLLVVASWCVKGATLILVPLFFIKKLTPERLLVSAYCLLTLVFFIVAPIREELYPWYFVWGISLASLLPAGRYPRIWEFTVILSFALELRHIPYMYMGYYGGPGPVLRIALTLIPLLCYFSWLVMTKRFKLWRIKNG